MGGHHPPVLLTSSDHPRPGRSRIVPSTNVDVSIAVVSYNSAHALPACLANLPPECPVILVDNCSGDASVHIARQRATRIVQLPRNIGYGSAANRGIAAADTPFVLLLNPDVVLEPGSVDILRERADRYPDAAVLAPAQHEGDGCFQLKRRTLLRHESLGNPRGKRWSPDGDCCVPFLTGSALLLRRETFLRLGGFDEQIFLYYEEDDLCQRLVDNGYSLIYTRSAEGVHRRGESTRPGHVPIEALNWHMAWSEHHVRRKHGLPDNFGRSIATCLGKILLSTLQMNRGKRAKYLGRLRGTLAFRAGASAQDHALGGSGD